MSDLTQALEVIQIGFNATFVLLVVTSAYITNKLIERTEELQ